MLIHLEENRLSKNFIFYWLLLLFESHASLAALGGSRTHFRRGWAILGLNIVPINPQPIEEKTPINLQILDKNTHRLWYVKQMNAEYHLTSVIIDLIRKVIVYFSQNYTHKLEKGSKWQFWIWKLLKMIPINPQEVPKKVPYRMAHPRTSVYLRPPQDIRPYIWNQ